jgi:hypothetical protein
VSVPPPYSGFAPFWLRSEPRTVWSHSFVQCFCPTRKAFTWLSQRKQDLLGKDRSSPGLSRAISSRRSWPASMPVPAACWVFSTKSLGRTPRLTHGRVGTRNISRPGRRPRSQSEQGVDVYLRRVRTASAPSRGENAVYGPPQVCQAAARPESLILSATGRGRRTAKGDAGSQFLAVLRA